MMDRPEIYPLLFGQAPYDPEALAAERDRLLRLAPSVFPRTGSGSPLPSLKDQKNVHLPISPVRRPTGGVEAVPLSWPHRAAGFGKNDGDRFLRPACSRRLTAMTASFYRPTTSTCRKDRLKLGYPWRGSPETHDVELFRQVVRLIRRGEAPLALPRFDHMTDDRGLPRIVDSRPRVCILEGWMIGKLARWRSVLSGRSSISWSISICPTSRPRRYRFKRRPTSAGRVADKGFSPAEMASFWAQSLEPRHRQLVTPYFQTRGHRSQARA